MRREVFRDCQSGRTRRGPRHRSRGRIDLQHLRVARISFERARTTWPTLRVDNRNRLSQRGAMAHTITEPQRKLIQKSPKAGRWNNEREIIRCGLHLVATEVEARQAGSFEPYTAGLLRRAYRRMSSRERKEEVAMARASASPQHCELK